MHPIWVFIFILIWAAITGSVATPNLALGCAVGTVSLFMVRHAVPAGGYTVRAWWVVALALLFLKELILSALQVAALVVRPNMNLKPGILAYKTTLQSDFEITLLANLITLTPGTLSVDVSQDRHTLYIHALDCSKPETIRRKIAQGFERRIREAFGR